MTKAIEALQTLLDMDEKERERDAYRNYIINMCIKKLEKMNG